MIGLIGMNREVADHLAVKTALVLQALGGRAIAKIIVTRKSGRAGKMRITSQHGIVFFQIRVCAREPCVIGVTCLFLSVIDGQYHRTQKGRLGTGQIIGPIRVQQSAVVFDLEEKVFDHATGKVGPAIAQQTQDDEVAVPAIHFVEASAGHHVLVLQIEQTMGMDCVGVDFAELMNWLGEVLNVNVAGGMKFFNGGRSRESRWKTDYGVDLHLGIDHRGAVGHGTREVVPTCGDILADGREAGYGLLYLRQGAWRAGEQKQEEHQWEGESSIVHGCWQPTSYCRWAGLLSGMREVPNFSC